MNRLLRDPLVHFLAIGAALFLFLAARDDGEDTRVIRISADQVIRAVRTRMPAADMAALSQAELAELIEPFVRDEVFYREALALGLDVDDDQVRTRLVEKMRYLSENLATPQAPEAAALEAYFAADPGRFAEPESLTFEQVFFSPQQRGEAVTADAQAGLAALADGAEPAVVGDRTPLGNRFELAAADRLQILFGAEMTAAVFAQAPGRWGGPYTSDFGLHLVRVERRQAARQPSYAEVAERVEADYIEAARMARNAAAYEAIAARYAIEIEWPGTPGGSPP